MYQLAQTLLVLWMVVVVHTAGVMVKKDASVTVVLPLDTTPVAANTTTTFVSIESGAKHSCALTSAGAMECWGSNEEGQMAEALWINASKDWY